MPTDTSARWPWKIKWSLNKMSVVLGQDHFITALFGPSPPAWFLGASSSAVRRAGIHDAHLHDLRHTAATWMAARGVSEHVIQEIMGHASIITTQIHTKGMARIANLYRELSKGLQGR